jgi:hypothetical protein
MPVRHNRAPIGWYWNDDEWIRIYEPFDFKTSKMKRKSLFKEIDDMLEMSKQESSRGNYTYTIACNKLHNNLPGPCVFILKGKKKLKPGKEKSKKPCKIYFSHYIDTKDYVATMMREDFERMFDKTIKAGRYRHMTCDFEFGKNKKPKKSE